MAFADPAKNLDQLNLHDGLVVADIGAGSTELIVFQQGAVAYTGVIPVGGDHFTSDLSVGMCTPLADAEKIKKVTPEQDETLPFTREQFDELIEATHFYDSRNPSDWNVGQRYDGISSRNGVRPLLSTDDFRMNAVPTATTNPST